MGTIWGISGAARAGKDSIAERLVARHGFVRVAFADVMKRWVTELFDFSEEQVWGNRKEDQDQRYPREGRPNLTPREALQILGTEFGRACYPGIWVAYGMRVAQRLLDGTGWAYDPKRGLSFWAAVGAGKPPAPGGVVFSDCRFRNELDAVRAAGGVLVRVRRPGKDGSVGVAGHASEEEQKAIPDSAFDFVVENDRDLEHLHAIVDGLVAIKRRDVALHEVDSFIAGVADASGECVAVGPGSRDS